MRNQITSGQHQLQEIDSKPRIEQTLTELLDAVFALETLALLDTLGALVKVVLERSTAFGLLALCWVVNSVNGHKAGRMSMAFTRMHA